MPNIFDVVIQFMNKNPQITNTPMGKTFMEALQNRDSSKGEELANNLLESQGMTREQAMNEAKRRLPQFPFFN